MKKAFIKWKLDKEMEKELQRRRENTTKLTGWRRKLYLSGKAAQVKKITKEAQPAINPVYASCQYGHKHRLSSAAEQGLMKRKREQAKLSGHFIIERREPLEPMIYDSKDKTRIIDSEILLDDTRCPQLYKDGGKIEEEHTFFCLPECTIQMRTTVCELGSKARNSTEADWRFGPHGKTGSTCLTRKIHQLITRGTVTEPSALMNTSRRS